MGVLIAVAISTTVINTDFITHQNITSPISSIAVIIFLNIQANSHYCLHCSYGALLRLSL